MMEVPRSSRTIVSTEHFHLRIGDDGMITLVLWDITVDLTGDELDELVGALTEAQAEVRKIGLVDATP